VNRDLNFGFSNSISSSVDTRNNLSLSSRYAIWDEGFIEALENHNKRFFKNIHSNKVPSVIDFLNCYYEGFVDKIRLQRELEIKQLLVPRT
jgi:hypothetical protein